MSNKTFWKAMHLLCSPFSLAAMLLLIVNDHLLRHLWPSWWTGKLGDLAWLLFFPFVMAVLLAWLIPPRVPGQEKIVGWTAFGLTGSVFVLAKTWPIFHDLMVRSLEAFLGVPVALVRDTTDLVALISLGIGWRLWERPSNPAPSRAAPGWIVLSLAMALTIANSVPSYGINNLALCTEEQQRYVYTSGFASMDGGLTWQSIDRAQASCQAANNQTGVAIDSNVRYRFTPGVAIERSEDGGMTWHREYTLSPNELVQAHFVREWQYNAVLPGPLNALVDPVTGNVIFAMGFEGVLVRNASGEWIWSPVGLYRHRIEFNQVEQVLSLLAGEILLAIGFALLSILTLLHRLHKGPGRTILLIVYWVLWGANALFFPPARQSRILFEVDYPLMFAGCLYLAFLVLWDVVGTARHSRNVPGQLAVIGLSAASLFFIPYILWALNIVPVYLGVALLALGLGGVVLFLGHLWTRELIQAIKEKTTVPAQ